MDKQKNVHSGLVLSKAFGSDKERVIFRFTAHETVKALICFALQFSCIFSSMMPFGVGFYASVFRVESWIVYFFASLSGLVVSQSPTFWVYVSTLIAQTAVFAMFDDYTRTPVKKATITALLFFAFSMARFMRHGYISYDIFALILETFIMGVFTVVFSYAVVSIQNHKKRSFISEFESLCVFASVSAFVLCFQNMAPSGNLHISSVISILLILVTSTSAKKSSALTLSVMLGVIGAISPHGNYAIMGTYPFAALLASSFKSYGKTGVVLGFIIANTASSLFLADSHEVVVAIYDCMISAVVFLMIPKKVLKKICIFFDKTEETSARIGCEGENPKSEIKKFSHIADSIEDLAKLYTPPEKERKIGKNYINMMTKSIESNVCTGCKMKDKCFCEDDGVALKMIHSFVENPYPFQPVNAANLGDEFKNICHRRDSFAYAFNHCIDIIKTEQKWLSKTNETRKLISGQLEGVANILRKECRKSSIERNREIEQKLRAELDRKLIVPKLVCARFVDDSDYEISVTMKDSHIEKSTRKTIGECIRNATRLHPEFSGIKRSIDEVTLNFCPSAGYSASFGYATKAKTGENVCGDSFNVIYTEKNKMVMVLSDGMGSGEKASKESKTTVELFEKFLSAGFECDNAVKLINSTLLISGNCDSFATADICDINLCNASVSFTKLGAADTYIKSDGTIRCIKGKNLPVGILREAQAQKIMLSIGSDTVIVLMSDGVADVALRNPEFEGWIEKELENLNVTNPQIIAGKLLEKAGRLQNNKICDDMTVLVGCITKSPPKK